MIASLQNENNKRQELEDDLRQQLTAAEKEKQELVKQCSKIEIEKAALAQQVSVHTCACTLVVMLISNAPAQLRFYPSDGTCYRS